MAIMRDTITVTAAGSAGAATGTGRSGRVVNGTIRAIHLDYSASAAATSDVTIVEGGNSPAVPVLAVADNATDGWYYPMRAANNAATGAALSNVGAPVVVADYLLVSMAQANAADTVTATVLWET